MAHSVTRLLGLGLTPGKLRGLHDMRAAEGWHARYGGGAAVEGGPAKVDKDAVY